MNKELIAQIIFILSLIGVGIIVFRKIPVLVTLSSELPSQKEGLILSFKKKIKKINPFQNFSYEVFLQKLLSRIRILTLKTENKTFNLLQKLREQTQKKKLENDNYWEELKKSTDKKDKNLPR
jgi:hypothetical protein